MKPKIFIGSSKEALGIAEALQMLLEPEFDCETWNQGLFQLGAGFLESLTARAEGFDFAVLVLAADDELEIRGAGAVPTTRDNVLFEIGLFTGGLGRERTFCVVPDLTDFRLPSNLWGIMHSRYDPERFTREGRSALGAAAAQIKEQARALGRCQRSRLSEIGIRPADIEGFYERTGLTEAFRARRDALNRMLEDIRSARRSVAMYARVYISELISSSRDFAAAIETAVRAGAPHGNRLLVTHTSTHSEDEPLAARVWELEDPLHRQWTTLTEYRHHLRRSDRYFDLLHEVLRERMGQFEPNPRPRIELRRGYLDSCLLPYSMLVIDSSIVYVSFYSLSKERFGKFAPTMRLTCDGSGPDTWARAFLQESSDIEHQFSRPGPSYPLI